MPEYPTRILIEDIDEIITMDEEKRVLKDHSILVSEDKISAIDRKENLKEKITEDTKVISGKDKVALPGFINSHAHGLSILTRGGISANRRLREWLVHVNRPGYEVCSIEEMKAGLRAFACECLSSGITTVVEMEGYQYLEHTEILIETLTEMGINVIYAPMFNDRHLPDNIQELVDLYKRVSPRSEEAETEIHDTKEIIAAIEYLIKKYQDSPKVTIWPSIRTIYEVKESTMVQLMDLAEKYDTMVTAHLAESSIMESEKYGLRAADYMATLGCLNDRMVFAHCVWVNDRDIRLIKEGGSRIVHNPAANTYLGSGIAPLHKFITAEIPLGLGLDNPNCNDGVNMFADMRLAALMHKGANLDPGCITTGKVLEMATSEGSQVIGKSDKTGSIKENKQADIMLVSTNHLHLQPLYNAAEALVYQGKGHEVDTVISSGKVLIQEGELQKAKKDDIINDLNKASKAVIKRANIDYLIED